MNGDEVGGSDKQKTGPQTHRRQAARRRGIWAEWLAAQALRLRGYRIVARNIRCRSGEIDLIARRGDLVAFVEVKARPSLAEAVDAVTPEAQGRIERAAEWWIARQRDAERLSWRFDIVAVMPRRWPVHVTEAW